MTTKVEKSILVNVPVGTAYNQWTQFEDFPQFMSGIKSVTHLSDDRLEWVAEIAGIRRQWEAKILEQVPDQKVAWAATSGATNAGEVTFEDLGGGQTSVRLFLEYEPEGLVEKVGDKLNVVENQAEGDLERFKVFIESEGYATGAWRGTINEGGHVGTPGVEHAAESQGDSGKAGVSGKVIAAGVGVAAAAAAAVAGARSGSGDDTSKTSDVPVTTPVSTGSVSTGSTSEGAGTYTPPIDIQTGTPPTTTSDADYTGGTTSADADYNATMPAATTPVSSEIDSGLGTNQTTTRGLGDADIESSSSGPTGPGYGTDADGTDTRGSDADGTDASDGDRTDSR